MSGGGGGDGGGGGGGGDSGSGSGKCSVKTHIWRGTWRGRGLWSRGCRRLGHRHEHRGVVVGSDSGGGSGDL